MLPVVAALVVVGGVVTLVAAGGLVDPEVLRPPRRARRDGLDFSGVLPASCRIGGDGVVEGPKAFRTLIAEDPQIQALLARMKQQRWTVTLVDGVLAVEGYRATSWRQQLAEELAGAIESAAWRPWRDFLKHFGLLPDAAVANGYRGIHRGVGLRAVALSAMPLDFRARVVLDLHIPDALRWRFVAELSGGESASDGMELGPRGLRFTVERDHLIEQTTERLDHALVLLAELGDPWVQFIEASDLVRQDDAGTQYAGLYQGVQLAVERSGGVVRFTARLGRPMPGGTLLIHSDHGRVDLLVNDAILDPLLTIQCADLPALSERIANDRVRGVLLDVVHGAPGSFVDRQQVVCVVKPPFGSLEPWARRVVELVAALSEGQG